MQVTTDLKQDDHLAFTRYVWYSGSRGSWGWFLLIFAAALVVVGVIETQARIQLDTPTMLVTMCILLGYLSLAQRRIRPFADGASLGMRTFKLVDEGLIERSRHHENLTRWSGIRSIEESKTHIFVFIDNCQAHIIPKRGFAEEANCAQFLDKMRKGVGNSMPVSFADTVSVVAAPCPT